MYMQNTAPLHCAVVLRVKWRSPTLDLPRAPPFLRTYSSARESDCDALLNCFRKRKPPNESAGPDVTALSRPDVMLWGLGFPIHVEVANSLRAEASPMRGIRPISPRALSTTRMLHGD